MADDDREQRIEELRDLLGEIKRRESAEREARARDARAKAAAARARLIESLPEVRARRESERKALEEARRRPVQVRFGGLARRSLYVDGALVEGLADLSPEDDGQFLVIEASREHLAELAGSLDDHSEPRRRAVRCIFRALGALELPAVIRNRAKVSHG